MHTLNLRSSHTIARCLIALAAGMMLTSLSSMAFAQRVLLNTSMGDIMLELDANKAPLTVKNFLQYVRDGHYDGTIFHRVIQNFMIQGGGMTPDLNEKATRPPIVLESRNGLKNDRGTVAMARRPDPNSATAQFFINVQNNDFLNAGQSDGYAVFGKVIAGIDIVDKIRTSATSTQGSFNDVPVKPILIQKATIQN